MEENPFPDKKLPFISVQYLPTRKSIYGEPDGALLEDNPSRFILKVKSIILPKLAIYIIFWRNIRFSNII
jgi:hypothetical protein